MQKLLAFIKKHWAGLGIVGLIGFVIIGGWTLLRLNEEPQPQDLGPELTYVGKRDFGCQIPRWTIYCDGEPSTEYYYATDMSKES